MADGILNRMLIVDAHLDLAYNAVRGRDVLRPAREQTADAEGIPSVGLPDLRAGNVGLIHHAYHLAEDSFWQLTDLSPGKLIASHSNCRSIVPTDRQLSDKMIRSIAGRDGVIGINFYARFLIPPAEHGKRRATLADVV